MADETDNVPTALTRNSFTRPGFTFAGWNTAANGSGTAYADGATYASPPTPRCSPSGRDPEQHGARSTATAAAGSIADETDNVPTALTGNCFTRAGFTFAGWNTAANGSGTAYADGATYPFTADATLFAQWTASRPSPSPSTATAAPARWPRNQQRPDRPHRELLHPRRVHLRRLEHRRQRQRHRYADGGHLPIHSRRHPVRSVDRHPDQAVTFNGNGGTGSMAPRSTMSRPP